MSSIHKSAKAQVGSNSSKFSRRIVVLLVVGLFAAVSFSAFAADFNWTGLGDGHSWSDANNWTNESGTAVAPTPASNVKHSYWFPVDDSGLVVTQDISGQIIVSSLIFERTFTAPVTVEMASKEVGCVLGFAATSSVDVPEGMTLYWKADANRWTNGDINKYGPGKLVVDLIKTPQTQRGLNVHAGTVEVAATSADTKLLVKMCGSTVANLPVYINHRDGDMMGGFDSARCGGTVRLNGTTVKVGTTTQMTGGLLTLPVIEDDGGTLDLWNERKAQISELTSSFGISLDRANAVVPDFASMDILWLFNDSTNPTRDDVGLGSRMAVSGSPTVVEDATRGSVLSFTGGAYFKGPDENSWLDGFAPTNDFSLAFWLKPDNDCKAQAKILFWGMPSAGKTLAMRLHNGTGQSLLVTTWRANQYLDVPIRDGKWHHVAVTSTTPASPNANNMTVYFDGVAVHQWRDWPLNMELKDLYIGNMAGTAWNNAGSGTPYTGLMDDFVIAPRCFSAQDIRLLYTEGPASIIGKPALGDFAAESSGAVTVESDSVSMKTLSGKALAGGVEMAKDGSTLTVGTGAGATATGFKGTLGGGNMTLKKEGAEYALALAGVAPSVTNVEVNAGTLTLRRPRTGTGLVACYSFDEADELGLDSTPGGMTLTKYGTGTGEFTQSADGIRNSALHFPGNLSLNSNGGRFPAVFPKGNESFTVSVWIKPTAEACSSSAPICCWGAPDNYLLSILRFNGANAITWANYACDHHVNNLTISDGNWHHVVITYDGSTHTKKLYYDNVEKLSTLTTGGNELNIRLDKHNFEIGHTASLGARVNDYYSGDMDEFMVFNYAWSADEVAAEYNRTATAPAPVDAASLLPAPDAHWTFDGEDPLAEASGNAALRLSEGTGTNGCTTVTFESGDLICGKAARFSATSGFLKLDTFPADVIPSHSNTFTIIVRYCLDTVQPSGYNPVVVGWGDDNGWSAGKLFRIGAYSAQGASARGILRGANIDLDNTYRTTLGDDRTRWCTVALSYQTPGFGNYTLTARMFLDGECKRTYSAWSELNTDPANFAIGSNAAGNMYCFGLVDDVRIYNRLLSDGEIRMITEQLEASKGKTTTGTAISAGVLTARPDVTVASGAKLKVASVETIGTLSGAGAIEIEPLARLNVSGVDGFSGTASGEGTLVIADGATLAIGDGSVPAFDVSCPLTLGEDVTVSTTVSGGKLLVARAPSFVGVENLSSWTASLPGDRNYSFVISQDRTRLYLNISTGFMLIIR